MASLQWVTPRVALTSTTCVAREKVKRQISLELGWYAKRYKQLTGSILKDQSLGLKEKAAIIRAL